MQFSESIDKLMPAVVKAWASIEAAVKNSTNPHLKNHYADLSSLMDAIKGPMAENELAVFQPVAPLEGDLPGAVVETYVMHSSGQWMMSPFSMSSVERKPQAIGATITYLRRYALGAMLGMVAEIDDDGNAGSAVTGARETARARPQPRAAAPASTPPVQAEQTPAVSQTGTDEARDLRNKLIEITGSDLATVKQYFKGIWPNGLPSDGAEYIEPLKAAIAYASRNSSAVQEFKANPMKMGENWAAHNAKGSDEETTTAPIDVNALADMVAKKQNVGNGGVLLKTIEKLFKDVPDYTDTESLVKFLQRFEQDSEVFNELKASAALGISLKDMMANA